jgi:hypothetical protein
VSNVRKYDPALTGAELIARERRRQIVNERWTRAHDDEHSDESLALAAACDASPMRLYTRSEFGDAVHFNDAWPSTWDQQWDKRRQYGDAFEADCGLADPSTYSHEQRIDLLVKAGALIAAEIDRLRRAHAQEDHS